MIYLAHQPFYFHLNPVQLQAVQASVSLGAAMLFASVRHGSMILSWRIRHQMVWSESTVPRP